MEKETVLILLLLKPMTKTSQLNDIAIMIYHGGCPVLKISIPCFLPLFWWKSHERNENEKRNCIVIETNYKNKSTKWKIQGRCFQMRTHVPNGLSRWRLEGVLSWTVSICWNKLPFLGDIVCNLNHDRFKWSFKLFLVINVLSKAIFSLHILCRLWMTILSLFSYWLFILS